MYYIVDRIEAGVAVCNCMATGEDVAIKVTSLPPGTREGHVLEKTGDGFVYDEVLTEKRRADLTARMNRLFERRA